MSTASDLLRVEKFGRFGGKDTVLYSNLSEHRRLNYAFVSELKVSADSSRKPSSGFISAEKLAAGSGGTELYKLIRA
jgi:hypothetical protein